MSSLPIAAADDKLAPSAAGQGQEQQPPHDALFLVLPYLATLWELLAISQVCVSLRDAVFRDDDLLPWMNLVVENPLSRRLSDDILLTLTSRAKGKLNTLALFDCFKVTDHGLLLVVRNNPLIRKLYVPGCTSLTPEGVINAVRILSSSSPSLNSLKILKINGIYNLSKEHLQTLHSYLQIASNQHHHHPNFLHEHRRRPKLDAPQLKNNNAAVEIDVEVCPRCDQVRMVFSCPKESCSQRRKRSIREDEEEEEEGCRGCGICIPRCVECGGCLDSGEEEEEVGVCGDGLCLGCWLQLPKCNYCNRPYCNQHYSSHTQQLLHDNLHADVNGGFVCSSCTFDDLVMGVAAEGDSDYY